jgi:riboflavin synthase
MFTGLVQCTGTVRRLTEVAQGRQIEVAAQLADGDRILGASVAVSGVCLTVTEASAEHFCADIGFETLDKTRLGNLQVGESVNLEPSLRIGDPIGGHLVSGHVDGVGSLRSIEARGDARLMWFNAPPELHRYIAVKGSICIDGVSLTVNEVDGEGFAVGLIPHTLEVTTLGLLKAGTPVNLEVDMMARYVERILSASSDAPSGGVSMANLIAAGFAGAGKD